MADVRYLHPQTDQDIPVARVLEGASQCRSVLILGELEDGTFYCAASGADKQAYLWWLEYFKHALLSGDFG